MEQLLRSAPGSATGRTSVWRSSIEWLLEKKLSPSFWIIFAAAFCFDFGISIFVFIFNLYLLDLHFTDRSIGLINGVAMLGSVVGTLPAGLLTRKAGIRPMLIVCFVTAPVLCASRALATSESAQLGLGFVTGLAMCMWGVCFLPAVARATTPENRASGFSLIFSSAIGTAMLGGVLCGYLPQWLTWAGLALRPAQIKRLVLLLSCAVAALGIVPALRLRLPSLPPQIPAQCVSEGRNGWRVSTSDPFLRRFLPAMALWTMVLTSFTPFANVYLSRNLHVPLLRIGLVFSTAQIIQFCVTLCTPILFRALGLVNGIVATQLATAGALFCLAVTHNAQLAVPLYLGFFGMQWMSSPGLYNLLMSKIPEAHHSEASSITLFCNALVGAGSTACAGFLFTRFGYPRVLSGIAALALAAAVLFKTLVAPAGAIPQANH
jgi:MFS family permease